MDEVYFDPKDSPEEVEAQRKLDEQDEALARRIRREVLRVQSGEAQEDIEREQAEQEAQEHERKKAERMERRRKASAFWQLLSGNILVNKGVARYYPHMIGVAVMFLLSIMVMFFSLHMDMRYSRLERDVQLLREKSLRLQSERFQRSSHSAIIEQLQKRGIQLEEAIAPSTLIED
ncbi:MAG: FtsL-like putative cell division protein [Rikenellaceae bacterium]